MLLTMALAWEKAAASPPAEASVRLRAADLYSDIRASTLCFDGDFWRMSRLCCVAARLVFVRPKPAPLRCVDETEAL
jgi:hypothetical protein